MLRVLSNLEKGEKSDIKSLEATGRLRRKLQHLGIMGGVVVECLQKDARGGISAYLVKDTAVALRLEDVKDVFVK